MPDIIARRVRRSTRSLAEADGTPRVRLPRAGNPAPEIFLWSRPAIWACGALLVLRLRAQPAPAGGGLGRPEADARPRRDHRRLGALGQRLVPAHRRARLRLGQGRRRRVLPALSGDGRRCSGACSSATTCSPGSSSRSRPRSPRSCSCTGSRRSGSAPTAPGGPCSTWPCSRSRSSCRPSTASRSTSCSRSPPSCSPSGGASRLRARSPAWRC